MKHLALVLFATSLLIGCGDDDDDDDDIVITPDAADVPDSGPTPDSAPVECLAQADYGTLVLPDGLGQWAGGTAQMPEFITVQGSANGDAQPDIFVVELYKGFGVFSATEIVPGTYTIIGDELNYATCGVCVRMFTDFDGSMVSDSGYLATGGTVTITSVSPNFVGSVDNITYEHVNVDPNTFNSTPHPDGCTSALTNTTWDVIPTEAM